MNSKKQLLAQFDWVNKWFHNSLDGFTDQETNQRLNKNMNHVKYLAGHLLNAQYGIGTAVAAKFDRKWDDLFAGLSKTRAQDNFPYPNINEIMDEWNKLYALIRSNFEALSDEMLSAEMPGGGKGKSGIFDSSIGDYIAFLNLHQMYHIGQIGILRRGFGKEPMKLS